ncbi:UPF0462 protein C4orf33 -like protein [Trichinella spiralis]|uniref:DNA-directed RNA polymerase I subunit H n=1 Tax=Trichinella spiralis TaxID=6334 RepID=A0A0V1BJG5_TRISP|nr:UPF0462 protein C4orf33 -like protein [Trichinella spiralis]
MKSFREDADSEQTSGTALIVPYGASRQSEVTATGFDFVIDKTWNNCPVTDHDRFHFHLEWQFKRVRGQPHKRFVKVFVDGPLFDDPPEPDEFAGHFADLHRHECVVIVFSNKNRDMLEVSVGPHGHWLVRLFKNKNKEITKTELDLEVQNVFQGNVWRCTFEIPLAFFPANVTRINAFACHGSGKRRHVDALNPSFNGSVDDVPDFHRLETHKPINIERLIPQGFNEQTFNDINSMEQEKGWQFPSFCTFCGTILPYDDDDDGYSKCFMCKAKITVPKISRLLVWQHVERFNQAKDTTRDSAKPTQDNSGGVTVEKKCAKCGHDKMSYSTRQTRSADEGMTVFFTCLNCGHKEIEHS